MAIGPLTVQAARERANELKALVLRNIGPREEHRARREAPTFKAFVEEDYLPHAKTRKRSWQSDDSKLRIWLLPRFGTMRLAQITSADLARYHNEVKAKRCASTANRHLALLSAIFSLAELSGVVERNPCSAVKQFQENNKRTRFLSPEEMRSFIQAAEKESNRMAASALVFLLLTGLRRGEALGAKWEHVDLQRSLLHLPLTKSGKARSVVLNSAAVSLLHGLERKARNPYVFPGAGSGALVNVTKAFKRIKKAAGLDDPAIVIHTLRHGFASSLINAGVSLTVVADLLGHSSPRVTAAHYAHLCPDVVRGASEKLVHLTSGEASYAG